MRSSSKAISFGMRLFLTLALLSSISSAATVCGNLTADYTMDASLFVQDTCFNVSAHNVTINCAGFSITGQATGAAVFTNGYQNVSVKNCIISNFTYGVWFNNAFNGSLSNLTLSNYSVAGIFFNQSNNASLYFISANSTAYAIWLNASNYSIISNSTVNATGSSKYGIYLSSSNFSSIVNSTANSSSSYGISLSSSSNNNIINSTGISSSNQPGIFIYTSSSYNNIINSTGISTSGSGIYLDSSSNNIINSTGISTSGSGIRLSSSSNNITNSTGISTSGSGIYLTSSSNNIINSTFISTTNCSFNLSGATSNNIINSSIHSTSGYDICSQSGAGKNTFINTTFNRSNIGWGTGTNNFTVQWFPSISAIYSNGSACSDCSINVSNVTGGLQYSLYGQPQMVNLTEFYANGSFIYNYTNQTNVTFYTPHNFTANVSTYNGTNTTFVNESSTINILLLLNTPPVINWVNSSNVTPTVIYNNSVGTICQANVTDPDGDYKFVNFTIVSPAGSILINEVNSTNVSLGDIYNSTNFTITQVGTYRCVVRAFDGTGNTTNSTTFDVLNNLPVINCINVTTTYVAGCANSTIQVINATNQSIAIPMANVSDADGFSDINIVNFTLTNPADAVVYSLDPSDANDSASMFNGTSFIPNMLGWWRITVTADDGTVNVSNTTQAYVNDSINGTLSFHAPTPALGANASGNITINISAWDNFNISRVNITINASFFNGNAALNCTSGAGTYYNLTCTYIWQAANGSFPDGNYSVMAQMNDTNNNTAAILRILTIDNTVPNVSFISPTSMKNSTGSLLINLSVNDSGTGVSYVQFRIENWSGNATPWLSTGTGSGTAAAGFWNFTFLTSSVADGLYNITINATDFAGASNKTVNISVTIDNTAPVLAAVSPVNGTAVSGVIVINFSINDSTSGVANATWRIEQNGANLTAWKDLSMGEGTIYAGHWNATYDTSSLAAGTYNVTANASDFGEPIATGYSSFIIQAQGGGGGGGGHHNSGSDSTPYVTTEPIPCKPPYCIITGPETGQPPPSTEAGQKPEEKPPEQPPAEEQQKEEGNQLAPAVKEINNKIQEVKAELDAALLELELKLKGDQFSPAAQAKFAQAKQAIAAGDYDKAKELLWEVRELMREAPAGQQNWPGLPLWGWSAAAVMVLAALIYYVKFRRRY